MNQKLLFKALAIISAFSGVIILTSVFYSIASYEGVSRQKYPNLVSPVVEVKGSKLGEADFTRASNWFVGGANSDNFVSSRVSFYLLSIPKLKIKDATVAVGGEDLSKSLIQYPGTALPGKRGNTIIFGHSILPQFYDPEDYLAIFSTLPTLDKGDLIEINYDGISYRYEVENMFEVLPTDIQVLEQNSSDSFLTLVTCVPPGHPLKPRRLIVRARIMPLGQANADIGN